MSITIDTTEGGAAANSYLSVADLTERIATLAAVPSLAVDGDGWDALAASPANDDALARIATMAADDVDLAQFPGYRYSSNQARQWPRVRTGQPRFDSGVPEAVLDAQAAQAAHIATAPSDADDLAARGVTAWSLGEQSESIDGAAARAERPRTLCAAAERILRSAGLVSRVGFVHLSR